MHGVQSACSGVVASDGETEGRSFTWDLLLLVQ